MLHVGLVLDSYILVCTCKIQNGIDEIQSGIDEMQNGIDEIQRH